MMSDALQVLAGDLFELSWSAGDVLEIVAQSIVVISSDGGVSSVNGQTGAVVLDADDVGADVAGAAAAVSAAKADLVHGHAIDDVSGLSAALGNKADLVGGFIPTSQIPAVAITEFLGYATSEAEMLTLVGQRGDWCIRTDVSSVYAIIDDDYTQSESWLLRPYPMSPVTSVNGQTGVIVLSKADVGLGNVPNVDARSRSTHTGTQPANTVTGLATVATSGSYNDLSDTPSGQYTRLFSRGRAALDRLLFTTFSPAQKLHNGFLTVPAEYNVVGGVCLFEFDLYTATIASQSGSFRIFLNESNVVSGGATNLGSNSLDGQALSCQFTFLRSSATHVVVALRVNGSLIAKQRLTGPSAPAIGTNADYSIRWQSTANEASLEYIESIFTAGYGNKP